MTADAVESGERLRVRLCDSDRFSADDALGVVEVDLASLVDEYTSESSSSPPARRTDDLQPERPGMRCTGQVTWSVRFCPVWQMSPEEMQKRLQRDRKDERKGDPSEEEMKANRPWWLELVESVVDRGPGGGWEEKRKERRRETLDWFVGETERDEIEAKVGASETRPSGILQVSLAS